MSGIDATLRLLEEVLLTAGRAPVSLIISAEDAEDGSAVVNKESISPHVRGELRRVLEQFSTEPSRLLLPGRRTGYTQKMKICGWSMFLRTGDYPDGSLGEIFVDIAKDGQTLQGLMSSFAIAVSIGLQYGVPLEVFVKRFLFTRFEPSGVVTGVDDVVCTSLVDALFRILRDSHVGGLEVEEQKPL